MPSLQRLIAPLVSNQQRTFLWASAISMTGSFAGLTAKGWLIFAASNNALMPALNFAALALPTLLLSTHAGVLSDRLGSRRVLIWSQGGLFVGSGIAACSFPFTTGLVQVRMLLFSTLVVGIASTYELTARNKYCALVVKRPEHLGQFLSSFSVVFNVSKLVGPPVSGLLLGWFGATPALLIDTASYLIPIATVMWLLQPHRADVCASSPGEGSLRVAWQRSGGVVRHTLRFTAVGCLVGFFHPGLVSVIAKETIGPAPYDLGLFTSVLAAGSVSSGILLRHFSGPLTRWPARLLGWSALITGLSQLGMAGDLGPIGSLAMGFGIGAGTTLLLAGSNLIGQLSVEQVMRGRVAGMGQLAILGGGGLSGLLAAGLVTTIGFAPAFAWLGGLGAVLALWEVARHGELRLEAGVVR